MRSIDLQRIDHPEMTIGQPMEVPLNDPKYKEIVAQMNLEAAATESPTQPPVECVEPECIHPEPTSLSE